VELLPNIDKVVIKDEKLTKYALDKYNVNGGSDKAIAFERALGYNISNYKELIENIKSNLYKFPATFKFENEHGKIYEVSMNLDGPNGKTAKVITGWILDNNNGETRLTSVYVKENKREKIV
jgi:hypothetical protein